MNLPVISPNKSPVGGGEEDTTAIFKRSEVVTTPDPPIVSRLFESDISTMQPKYMTGYGGFQPAREIPDVLPKLISAPVVGYTGYYRGKNLGKLGRAATHRTRLSAWEQDTVSDILGIPTAHNEWEFSHYTNTCTNFSEKKFHESVCTSVQSRSGDTAADEGGSLFAGASTSTMGSPSGHFSGTQQQQYMLDREDSALDRVLQHIQQCLETKFKHCAEARSALKAAFFSFDPKKKGRMEPQDFFDVLYRLAGVVLPGDECALLRAALNTEAAPTGASTLDLSHPQYSQYQYAPCLINYGRFLNIVVPRVNNQRGKSGADPNARDFD